MDPDRLLRHRAVTPFLFLGSASPGLPDVHHVRTGQEAVDVIRDGGTAVLPVGSWDKAEEALRLMSPDRPDLVARAMRFAQSGRLD